MQVFATRMPSPEKMAQEDQKLFISVIYFIQTDFFFAMPVDFNFSSAGLCPAWTRGVCQFVCDLLPFAVAACHQVNIPRIKCKL